MKIYIPAVNFQSGLRTMLIHIPAVNFQSGLQTVIIYIPAVNFQSRLRTTIYFDVAAACFVFVFFISVLIHAVVEFLEVQCYVNQPLCITEQSISYSVLPLPPQLRPSVSESGLLHVARRPCPSLSCSLVSVGPRQSL